MRINLISYNELMGLESSDSGFIPFKTIFFNISKALFNLKINFTDRFDSYESKKRIGEDCEILKILCFILLLCSIWQCFELFCRLLLPCR